MISGYANPLKFLNVTKPVLPILAGLGLLMVVSGWVWGLGFTPEEKYQGATARIMYVHVPAAIVSMGAYFAMAISSLIYLVLRHNIADTAAKCAAPIAAALSFICLLTGALWGKPTWGTYWIWDARLTSMLFQLVLLLGYMALRSAFTRDSDAARASAILCLVGAINLPIIKFSVDWWNTLHQPAGFITLQGTSLSAEFFWPLLYNLIGLLIAFSAILIALMRADIFQRQYDMSLARLNRSST